VQKEKLVARKKAVAVKIKKRRVKKLQKLNLPNKIKPRISGLFF
jgi:hypothetical protein